MSLQEYLKERLKMDPNNRVDNQLLYFGEIHINMEHYLTDERIPKGAVGFYLCGLPGHGNFKWKGFRWPDDLEESKHQYYNKWRNSKQ